MNVMGLIWTLVQLMAWCRQETSHYLSQYWPRSLSPYGVTRPQWVNPSDTEQPRSETCQLIHRLQMPPSPQQSWYWLQKMGLSFFFSFSELDALTSHLQSCSTTHNLLHAVDDFGCPYLFIKWGYFCFPMIMDLHHTAYCISFLDIVQEGYTMYVLNSLAPGKFEWNFRHVIFK